MFRLKVELSPTFRKRGVPKVILTEEWVSKERFDVTSDGRILIPRGVDGRDDDRALVTQNWGDELRRRAEQRN